MENRYSQSIRVPGLALLVCVGLLLSCGDRGQNPVHSDAGFAAAKPTKSTVTVADDVVLAVITDGPTYQESTTEYVPLSGNVLSVTFPKYAEEGDIVVREATFWVPADAMADGEGHDITMTVQSGTTLDDVQILFGPSGLTFEPHATLWLTLLGPVTEADVQQVAHIAGDGYIENIDVLSDKKGVAKLLVTIRIPGFSRYSLGDGDFAEADGPAW
jgi:hypothetical protein